VDFLVEIFFLEVLGISMRNTGGAIHLGTDPPTPLGTP
jgi:hypothetical protein